MMEREEQYQLDDQARRQASAEKVVPFQSSTPQRSSKDRTVSDLLLQPDHLVRESDLNVFSRVRFDQPVISLHMHLTPQLILADKKPYITLFHSLRHETLEREKSILHQMPHQDKVLVDDQLQALDKYLADDFSPEGGTALSIYLSGDELQKMYLLKAPGDNYLAIDYRPYVLPLERLVEAHPTLLFARIDKNTASIYRYKQGNLTELLAIQSSVPTQHVDKGRPNKNQRNRHEYVLGHLDEVADRIRRLFRRERAKYLVIEGEAAVWESLRSLLSKPLREKLLERISLPKQEQTLGDYQQQLSEILSTLEHKNEKMTLDSLDQQRQLGRVVEGIDAVIEAQNRSLLRSLVIGMGYHQPGYQCDADRALSVHQSVCPVCEAEMRPIDDVYEELVQLARVYRLDLSVIAFEQARMDYYQGIAGEMYQIQNPDLSPRS
jgi:Fe-S cluster assembly iron-binding protein IscA